MENGHGLGLNLTREKMGNNYLCKGCKGYLESIFLHGKNYFWKYPYTPYKLAFLCVDSGFYYDDFGVFLKNFSHTHPRKLNSGSRI